MGKGKRNRAVREKTGPNIWKPTKKQDKAMKDEIRRQVMIADKQYNLNFCAMVLWALHQSEGFGPVRLRRFWDSYDGLHRELKKHYEMEEEDMPFVCVDKLREIGVDLEAWEADTEKTAHPGG